jgi:hypothetical protein
MNSDNLNINEPNENTELSNTKSSKWLSGLFNFASGAAIALAVKTCVFSAVACTVAPSVFVTLSASAASGAIIGGISAYRSYQKEKKEGKELPPFWSTENFKKNWKKIAFTTGFSLAGGMTIEFFAEDIKEAFCKAFNYCTGAGDVIPEAEAEPEPETINKPEIVESLPEPREVIEEKEYVLTIVPEEEPIIEIEEQSIEETEAIFQPSEKLLEAITILEGRDDLPQHIISAMEKAQEGDAQAIKDIAHFMFNDCERTLEIKNLAAHLAYESSLMGNTQAKEFWNFILYWGMSGVEADKETALAAMKTIETDSAKNLVGQWTGEIPMVQIDGSIDCDEDITALPAPVENETITPIPQEIETPVTNEPPFTEENNIQDPIENEQPKAEPIPVDNQNEFKSNCTALISVEEGVSFICDIPSNTEINVGDDIIIEDPPVSSHMLIKDEDSSILFSMPKP